MVTKSNYEKKEVSICLSVIVEVMTILGSYRDSIILIGGWVPYFILDKKGKDHIGSIDIDLALDSKKISDESYRSILELLKKRGYIQGSQPFIFNRKINTKDGLTYFIEIDLLSREYGGTSKSHRTQRIQEINARKARGCDLAFEHNITLLVKSIMPDGAENEVNIKVASIVPFLVMKDMALWERMKEKDAYDIYFTILNYPGGIDTIAEIFKPVSDNKLVREGLGKILAKFNSINSIGPTWLVNFLGIEDESEIERIKRDCFERVTALIKKLGIKEYIENIKKV
ncbi:MAG: hypothetical protein M1475_07210 [Actinobacteria bacterium]|nr:hypothetical protein [Actinomycetota bacterium]